MPQTLLFELPASFLESDQFTRVMDTICAVTGPAAELAVEAMRKKAADDALARGMLGGQNTQIDVRVAKLRATWTGSPEDLELAIKAMREKAAAARIACGESSRQTEGDVVRLELVLPAGDSRAQVPLISTPDLEIAFKASDPNSRRVVLNKTICTNLGFAHLLSSKAKYLYLSLKFSPTDEIKITSRKLGTSLKPGWEGAELRAVLVRKAAGVAAKDDKEDEEDDA